MFAVGTSGTILHYDGDTWTAMQPAPTYFRYGVWGTSENEVFAVGPSSTIHHYDRTGWTTMVAPGLYQEFFDVWGSSGNDVSAVGSLSGVIFHYNGNDWTSLQ